MKAWFVFIPDEWGELIHADTRGKAKTLIMQEFGVDDYLYLGAARVSRLDNVAFTFQHLCQARWNYVDEDGKPLKEVDFYNVCKCNICKGAQNAVQSAR